MSVKSAPYYWLICDCCGAKSTEDSEHSAWSEEADALMIAEESDWMRIDGKDYCWRCIVMGEEHWQPHAQHASQPDDREEDR